MKKIRGLIAVVLLACSLAGAAAEGVDIVVLMDASGTILPYFEDINNRILVDVTRKFVRPGDTFHLISFNSRVNLEIAQKIKTEADVSRVVSRFMLLYPLGQNSDFLSGLHYAHQYVSSLPQSTDKVVIVISDGIFNPPASSTYVAFTADQVKAEISKVATRIRAEGWSVYYIKIPFPKDALIRDLDGDLVSGVAPRAASGEDGADGAPSAQADGKTEYREVSSEFTSALDIPTSDLPEGDVPVPFVDSVFSMPEVSFPKDMGKKGRYFTLPLRVRNVSDRKVHMELTGVFLGDANLLAETAFLTLGKGDRGTLRARVDIPESIPAGPQSLGVRLQFSDNMRVVPQFGTINVAIKDFSVASYLHRHGGAFVTIVLLAIAVLLVLIILLVTMRRTSRPAADAVSAAAGFGRPRDRDEGAPATDQKATERSVLADFAGPSTRAPALAGSAGSTGRSDLQGRRDPTGRHVLSADARASQGAPQADRSVLQEFANRTNERGMSTETRRASGTIAASAASTGMDLIPQGASGSEKAAILASAAEAARRERIGEYTQEEAAKKERFALLSSLEKRRARARVAAASARDRIEVRRSGNAMFEIAVDNQNPHIGRRNVHVMKAGSRLSVGGGHSPFLVFLVKFPPRIAELRFDGERCDLAILRPEYFPYAESSVIEDCVGKEIVAVSDKDYEVRFTFRVYEDPVRKLNDLLTSISGN